jgi:hypothetical protein
MVQKNPRQLSEWFEKVSGSGELREEYDNLKVYLLIWELIYKIFVKEALKKSNFEASSGFFKKKTISNEKKIYAEQKKEAEHFNYLMTQRVFFFFLFILFLINNFFF